MRGEKSYQIQTADGRWHTFRSKLSYIGAVKEFAAKKRLSNTYVAIKIRGDDEVREYDID